jgi:hypothetical protein
MLLLYHKKKNCEKQDSNSLIFWLMQRQVILKRQLEQQLEQQLERQQQLDKKNAY